MYCARLKAPAHRTQRPEAVLFFCSPASGRYLLACLSQVQEKVHQRNVQASCVLVESLADLLFACFWFTAVPYLIAYTLAYLTETPLFEDYCSAVPACSDDSEARYLSWPLLLWRQC